MGRVDSELGVASGGAIQLGRWRWQWQWRLLVQDFHSRSQPLHAATVAASACAAAESGCVVGRRHSVHDAVWALKHRLPPLLPPVCRVDKLIDQAEEVGFPGEPVVSVEL